jgi:hypothetical protein
VGLGVGLLMSANRSSSPQVAITWTASSARRRTAKTVAVVMDAATPSAAQARGGAGVPYTVGVPEWAAAWPVSSQRISHASAVRAAQDFALALRSEGVGVEEGELDVLRCVRSPGAVKVVPPAVADRRGAHEPVRRVERPREPERAHQRRRGRE